MSVTEKLDGFQQRHSAAGYPLAVVYKFFDDHGNYLAALIAYYAFISLFPLIFLLTTVLAYVLVNYPGLQTAILNSALGKLPGIGDQVQNPERMAGGFFTILFGVLGSLYGATGVAQALQHAVNTAWGVPRNSRPNPFRTRGRSLLLIGTAGLAVLGITVLSVLVRYAGVFGINRAGLGTLTQVGTVLLYTAVFIVVYRLSCARPITVRNVAPGALGVAIALQLLQLFGATIVQQVAARINVINGVFALVLGLLFFLYLAMLAVVFCAEADVVRVYRLYPRSLLTPFTDNVTLTAGDRRAYSRQTRAQRSKGFQQVDVSFDPTDDDDHDGAP